MAYSMFVHNNFIDQVRADSSGDAISKDLYDNIVYKILHKPEEPEGWFYALRADTLEWELVELPPMPNPEPSVEDKAEAYDILMGGAP